MASGRLRHTRGRPIDQPRGSSRSLRPSVDTERFGRISETVARYIGSWAFIMWMTIAIIIWVGINLAMSDGAPDPFPFIFLTLLLSLQASYAAPLILLAQNRQTDRDRVQFQDDRQRTERLLADADYLAREIAAMRQALGEVATRDYVRGELRDMIADLDELLDEREKKRRKAEKKAEKKALEATLGEADDRD